MIKLIKLLYYYLLLITGLIMASWLIWSRFVRERTIRDIPDELLTEYRFWILLYICFIYLLVIKNLVKPTKSNIMSEILYEIVRYIYKPLMTLDHLIKYNKYVKPYYYKLVISFAQKFYKIQFHHIHLVIFFMQVFPRIILVSFLLIDIFYFHRLEIFYKVILIGLLPFILRYIKYSLKDIYNYWVTELQHKYQSVEIYEVGYQFDEVRVGNTDAIYHGQEKTITEYIEIKFDNTYDYLADIVGYQYESYPFIKDEFFDQINYEKYNTREKRLTTTDLKEAKQLYYDLMPNILYLKQYFFRLEIIDETKTIKWSKIIIFSLYFICWSFVLITSYKHFPVDFNGAKYLILNLCRYLMFPINPFNELYWGSLSQNLITYKSVKYLITNIINNLLSKFL